MRYSNALKSLCFAVALTTTGCLATSYAQAQTATIALRVNVNTLDPHMSASVGSDLSVLSHIYPALILRGPDLKLKPSVAKSWEMINDTTWRFHLVDGAKFADGEPIDANTVKWNLDRVKDPKVGARIAAWFALVSGVKVIDPLTVDIETSKPFPALADQLSMFFMLPPKWAATHNPAQETMSGGPYKVAENVPGDHITLTENPDYWGKKPKFDKVIFRTIPEMSSRVAALEAGEVDLITGVTIDDIKNIDASGKAKAGVVDSTRSMLIKFNAEKAPMNNVKVRQAVNYAMDKEGIADAIFGGKATVSTCQLMTPAYFGYNPNLKPYPYDPDKAIKLLKESGADLSKPIEFDVPVATYLQGSDVAQIIAQELTEVGLKVKINEMEFGSYMNKMVKAHKMGDISLLGLAWATIDADGMLSMFSDGNVYDYWHNKPFSKLLAEARTSSDKAKRQDLYNKATKMMCDEAGAGFLYVMPATYGVSDRVTWHARGDDWVRAMDMEPKQQ